MRQPHDAIMNAGGLCGLDDLIPAGLRISQRNVIGHGVVGQSNVLEHNGYLVEQPLIAHLPNIQAIHLDRAGIHIIEPGDQSGDRGFPTTRRSHQGGDRACRNLQIHVA